MTLDSREFGYIQDFVRSRSGIVLETGKEYLAESRLLPVARDEGLDSITDLIVRLRSERSGTLHRRVVEALTTNETYFFRDFSAWEALRRGVLPDLMVRRAMTRRINIWCAACSSGQEPYSIAMILREDLPNVDAWFISILASDISVMMLEQARSGRYNQIEVNRGLPASLLVKYFRRDGLDWEISTDVRGMVDFREINLAETLPPLPQLDLIVMRNVLIYFDMATRKGVLGGIRRALRSDGYLFLGGTETTFQIDDGFERVEVNGVPFYRLRGPQE